jgi:Domain of unknown function (DUF4150)
MTITIQLNGSSSLNSLCHKGCNSISTATLPDVCKTPSPGGPVPVPYPNVSMSSDLANGTKTVKADGGNMIAVKGSEFSRSTGDEPGTAGGIKSSTNMKESKWLTYSFDVKIEGKNACRLSDKKTQNHANTVDAMGTIHAPVVIDPIKLLEQVACECQKEEQPDRTKPKENQCEDLIDRRGSCVTKKLKDKEEDGIWANARFEAPEGMKNPKTNEPVTRLVPDAVMTAPGSFPQNTISVGKRSRATKANMTPGPVEQVIDFKFPCPPSTKKPYTEPDGKGYGLETGPGEKELNAYRDISSPPRDVKVITPSEELCG